jgi:uncharacterized cofD-like protein
VKEAHERKKIVVIGGGTGTYTTLMGLKKYPFDLSVIITMMDTGGSNRVIRDEFGLLPTSDIRQCMVALASNQSHEVLRKLFTYRYSSGTGISGMTFGNLFMAALTDIYSSQKTAIKKTCEILDVQGKIIPVTYDSVYLSAKYDDGLQVLGEHLIDEPPDGFGEKRIVQLEVIPKAKPNKDALIAIGEADLIVFSPGDLYTSVICNLVVDGIAEAIKKSKAKKIYVMNIMTKYGQTNNFKASDHIAELEKYLGKGTIDFVLINKSMKFSGALLNRYKKEKAVLVQDDLKDFDKIRVIRRNFISNEIYEKPKADNLTRSLIRHNSASLAKAIFDLTSTL